MKRTAKSKFEILRKQLSDEQLEQMNDVDLRTIVRSLRLFFPPVSPVVAVVPDQKSGPITRDSSVQERLLVEHFAKCFQTEAQWIYNRPGMLLQFDAFGSRIFEAWIAYIFDDTVDRASTNILGIVLSGNTDKMKTVLERENLAKILKAIGCCLFYQDDGSRLTKEQCEQSAWIAAWTWVHPDHRYKGAFKYLMKNFDKYGEYWIEGPLSTEMKDILEKYQINQERVIQKKQGDEGTTAV